MKRIVFILISYVSFTAFLQGQCPDRDILWKRILYLRDSSQLSPKEKLTELHGYLGKMNTCPYRNDSTHVKLLLRIEDVYFQQADYLNAVQYRRQAINIITANAGKSSVPLKTLPGIYYWLSVLYDSLNNVTEKMRALDSCADIAMKLKLIDRASLQALLTRVEYFFDVGDYYRCIDYATRCETLGREHSNSGGKTEYWDGMRYASSSLHWKVNALLKLKNYEAAEKLLVNKVDEYKKTGLKNYLGTLYSELAYAQIQKVDYEKAILFFNQAFKSYQEDKDYFNCKQTLNIIGYEIYFKHFNDGDKALVNYKNALRYVNKEKSRNLSDVFESLSIFANVARVYIQKGFYDSAFKYFQLAFDQIKPGSNEAYILQSPPEEIIRFKKIHYLTGLLIAKGDAYRQQYNTTKKISDLREAVRIYRVADQLLGRVKAGQFELQSKLFWRSDSRRLYENAIEACYLQGNIPDAFYFFERSRAVLLNDQLNEQRFLGEQDIMKQTQIKKKILQLQKKESEGTDKSSDRFSELQNELFNHKQELDRLQQIIKTNNPLYYQSFLDSTVITIQDVRQNILNDHQAMVELFNGDSAVYVLIITAQNINLKKIDKASFENLSNLFISYISSFDLLNRNYDEFIKISSQLYQLIFGSISLPPRRIIISPDGQYFPFEALVTSVANQPLKWFLNDHAVSYAYSARFLMNDFNSGSATTGKNFMGFAPVNYPVAFSLAALPGSDQSLYKIAGYFDNALYHVATSASRNNFQQQFSQYRIIQLYTHAADSSSNNEPVIYFADSALYLSDLINEYKPLTRLIVLSACETGTGKNYHGEGVFSFNRGFAALGIPAAITNLWSVDNGSTYLLTELFYKWLAKGLPTDVALQKAKLEFLKMASREKSMPCYWAGPVLVGKTDIIELSKPYPWKWIVLFASVVCIVIWLVRKKVFLKIIKPTQIPGKNIRLSKDEQFN